MNTENTVEIATFGPDHAQVEVGDIAIIAADAPFRLDCGAEASNIPIAYQTYGTLNADKSNAVLVCHGLTGDQYANSPHPVTDKPGWWEMMIGAGQAIDTDTYYVISTNVIGSCMGSWGPKSINPETGKAYGLSFPVVTIADMVRAQVELIDQMGIDRLAAVIGGSMGGMQALAWAANYPDRLRAAVPIATSAKHSAQNIAFHEIGRQAIMADPDWQGGNYIEAGTYPSKGLAVARMTAHVTYVSETALAQKFGRDLQDKESVGFGFDADFQVESYLRYQGSSFVNRFDPNAYLYITRAMDYFDVSRDAGGNLAEAFTEAVKEKVRFCVVSFSSDWCFPTSESRNLVRALNAAAANVSFAEVETDKGHDAFLLDSPAFKSIIRGFMDGLDGGAS